MRFKLRRLHAFSLVELTLALGIAAFCLIAVFGLVPVGVQTNRNATSQTAATNILTSVVSDIRASPPGQTKSVKYRITRNKNGKTTLYFDGQGQFTAACYTSSCPPGANSRYRLYVLIGPDNPGSVVYPAYAWLKVSWPAAVDPINTTVTPSGSVETVAAYFVQ
jgi:Tfp pilus assembly protein PilV